LFALNGLAGFCTVFIVTHACRACEWSVSEWGRNSGGTGVAENDGAGAEREVAECERSGER